MYGARPIIRRKIASLRYFGPQTRIKPAKRKMDQTTNIIKSIFKAYPRNYLEGIPTYQGTN